MSKLTAFYKLHQEKLWEIFWYLFFGVLSMALNIAVYFFFTKVVGWNYLIANLIAWIAAVLFAFLTNKFFVFKSQTAEKVDFLKEMASFFGFRIVSLILDVALLFLLMSVIRTNEIFAKGFSQFAVVVANYVFSKLFIFKASR